MESLTVTKHIPSRFVDDTELGSVIDKLNVRGPIQMRLNKSEDLANRKINEKKIRRRLPCTSKD